MRDFIFRGDYSRAAFEDRCSGSADAAEPAPALTAPGVDCAAISTPAIPHIVHQTWKSADLPPRFAKWRQAWRTLHPQWDHRFYDDADIRRVIADRAPRWLSVHDRLPRAIQRVDLFRYLIVYLDGGLYADLDMEPHLPSDSLVADASCVFCVEFHLGARRQKELGYRLPWQIANCIFAAAPGHEFFAEILDEIGRRASNPVIKDADVEDITGPRMLTRLAFALTREQRGAVRILPQINWMAPREYPRIGPLARLVHASHATAGTWRTARIPRLWYNSLTWSHLRGSVSAMAPELP